MANTPISGTSGSAGNSESPEKTPELDAVVPLESLEDSKFPENKEDYGIVMNPEAVPNASEITNNSANDTNSNVNDVNSGNAAVIVMPQHLTRTLVVASIYVLIQLF